MSTAEIISGVQTSPSARVASMASADAVREKNQEGGGEAPERSEGREAGHGPRLQPAARLAEDSQT